MARIFTTQQILDASIEQIVITRTTNATGATEIRVRSNVTVTLVDSVDPLRTTKMNLTLNKTIQELGIAGQVNTIRSAILTEMRNQIV